MAKKQNTSSSSANNPILIVVLVLSILALIAVIIGVILSISRQTQQVIVPDGAVISPTPVTEMTGVTEVTDPTDVPSSAPNLNMVNPASANCTTQGGQLQITSRASDGGQYGICVFEDNRQCEEWALYRGECPVGGVKVTGYDNQAQTFCAITGGEVDMTANTCTRAGVSCDINAYYDGQCDL